MVGRCQRSGRCDTLRSWALMAAVRFCTPASFTGLVGIKAQFAWVPVFPTSATPTLAHVDGLMADSA